MRVLPLLSNSRAVKAALKDRSGFLLSSVRDALSNRAVRTRGGQLPLFASYCTSRQFSPVVHRILPILHFCAYFSLWRIYVYPSWVGTKALVSWIKIAKNTDVVHRGIRRHSATGLVLLPSVPHRWQPSDLAGVERGRKWAVDTRHARLVLVWYLYVHSSRSTTACSPRHTRKTRVGQRCRLVGHRLITSPNCRVWFQLRCADKRTVVGGGMTFLLIQYPT